ncbi:MAG: hypothetical protein K8R54_14315 [Bacteroidales bacterium]|nr:hypothetical protein [Bacteroidales bacterium]
MSKQTRIIKISNNKLYYTSSDFIQLSETNFTDTVCFNERFEIYWLIEILEYQKERNLLIVTVVDYKPADISVFYEQKAKSKINSFEFYKLKWEELEPLLSSYQKIKLNDIVDDINKELTSYDEDEFDSPTIEKVDAEQFSFIDKDNLQEIKPDTKPKKYTKHFTYYFKDAEFKLGYVSVKGVFDFYYDIIDLRIYNDVILPEYDFIKNYFPKVFNNNKQFNVKAIIEIKGDNVVKKRAYSEEIKLIDEKLIDSVKRLRTLELAKVTQNEDIDKSLFTADEIWDNINDEGIDGNVFKQDEADIINTLLSIKDVRNRKQLEYLAGYKHNPKEKIRFTLRPLFGFIFYIEGETMNHFCWELLNSHATYLWSFEKEEKTEIQIKRVEEIINIVRDTGRQEYKSAYLRNELDTDVFFNTINHKHANSDFIDGFVLWKHKLKEMIV